MNNWQTEILAEAHRQQLLEESEQVRMEQQALSIRPYRSTLYSRTMFNFANWMISAGKELRKRYEVPAVTCNHKESFAH